MAKRRWAVALLLLAAPAVARAETIYIVYTTVGAAIQTLATLDSATPGTVTNVGPITGLQTGDQIEGIDFRPATGELFAITLSTVDPFPSRLYTIDPATAAATQRGIDNQFSLMGGLFGMDFNPVVDLIRVVSSGGLNLRLDPNDGTLAFTDTNLAYAVGDPKEGDDDDVGALAYTNNVDGAMSTTAYVIDDGDGPTANLATLVPPNDGVLNTVGTDLGPSIGDHHFDISPNTGIAFAALDVANNSFSLYTVNLATGVAAVVGLIGNGSLVLSGMSVLAREASIPEIPTLPSGGLVLLALLLGAVGLLIVTRQLR